MIVLTAIQVVVLFYLREHSEGIKKILAYGLILNEIRGIASAWWFIEEFHLLELAQRIFG